MIVLLILFILAGVFYFYCNKKISLPEGYTVVQARSFYKACLKNGLNSRRKMEEEKEKEKEKEIMQTLVNRFDFASGLDEEGLWKLYCAGRSVSNLNNGRNDYEC